MRGTRLQDLQGQKFNKLTALKFTKIDSNHNKIWLFSCECGIQKEIVGSRVKCGQVKSCGCSHKENAIVQSKKRMRDPLEKAKDELFTDYKRDAKKRGLLFVLNKEHFQFLISNKCHYCDASPLSDRYGLKFNGIDRKNSAEGYTQENCLTSCSICNRMKSNMVYEQFLDHISNIYRHRSYAI